MATNGWPDDWNLRKAGDGCPMCVSLGSGDNDHTVAVAELAYTEVRLEPIPWDAMFSEEPIEAGRLRQQADAIRRDLLPDLRDSSR